MKNPKHTVDVHKKLLELHGADLRAKDYVKSTGSAIRPSPDRSPTRDVAIGDKWPDGTQIKLKIATDGTGVFLTDRSARTIMLNRSEVFDLLRELNKEFILESLGNV